MAFGQYLGYIGGVIGAIIGGVIGSYFPVVGTSAGAMWGFSIGSMLGGVAGQVFWPEQAELNLPPPPQPHETRLQFSSWGAAIPIQYASGRLAGNIIYMSDINQTVTRSKHRQDGVRYYELTRTYTATFAIAFCDGRPTPEGIARIWMNNKVIADYRDPELYPSGWVGYQELNIETTIARSLIFLNIYLGSETQTVDPAIAALLTADEVPAYRGTCYIVFKDFPIGEFSGVPQIQIEIGKVGHGVWIERRPIDDSNHPWQFVASNGDGSILMVGSTGPGYLYLSEDFGHSWSQRGLNKYWYDGTLNATGKYGIAVDFSRLYITSDAGLNWVEARPMGDVNKSWCDASISNLGDVMLVVSSNQRIYKSSNYGSSWSEQTPLGSADKGWWRCACSADGSVLIAALAVTSVYISTDYGLNWTERKPTGGVTGVVWMGLECSADGSVIIITQDGGRIYVSLDTGATWSEKRPAGNNNYSWRGATCNDSGSYMAASMTAGYLYISNDYGESWEAISTGIPLVPGVVDMDQSGRNLIICNSRTYSGRVYTYRE